MTPPVAIIGAGLSGLTLGLCLKNRGIAAVIYDRATSPPRYNYGISLRASTYKPLLNMLHMEETVFRERLSVNAQQASSISLSEPNDPASGDAFRCHRGQLEALLGDGLSISWDKRLKAVALNAESPKITAVFDDGHSLETACLIGCDGPHSITRQSLSPNMKFEVLPYVVFNGKRRLTIKEYTEKLHQYMQSTVLIHTNIESTRLEIAINGLSGTYVDLSYTYSRPARANNDPLYKPNRPIAGATNIPEAFYDELASLRNLQAPFAEIFHPGRVRDDRLLHWLMRSLVPDKSESARLAKHGVVLIGDAVHATPILGGDGANTAIRDGIELAEHIAAHGVSNFERFLEGKFDEWTDSVVNSKKAIKDMHTSEMALL